MLLPTSESTINGETFLLLQLTLLVHGPPGPKPNRDAPGPRTQSPTHRTHVQLLLYNYFPNVSSFSPTGTLVTCQGQSSPTVTQSATRQRSVSMTTGSRHSARAESAWAEEGTRTFRSQSTTLTTRNWWSELGPGPLIGGRRHGSTRFSMHTIGMKTSNTLNR